MATPEEIAASANIATVSAEEVAAMLIAVDMAELIDAPEMLAYLTGAINEAMLAADDTLRATIAAQLTGQASDATLEAAQAIADRESKKWASEWAGTELKKMGDVIRQGLAEGLGPKDVARRLEMVQGLDSGRAKTLLNYADELAGREPALSDAEFQRLLESKHTRLLNDRKKVIAQDQMRKATEEGARELAKAEGKKVKNWMTVGDERVSDQCMRNEIEGWIGIDEAFGDGNMQPPGHPRCRCTLTYRVEVDKAAEERAKARADATKAAKDAAEETK